MVSHLQSLNIIHEMDDLVAFMFNFSEEEYSFLKNYDINFRAN